nr:hypothetical protein GCM10017745_01340 [Saccharothrix mutabilis subsp. capreolus]
MLGLGNLGPAAALPVMEGKAALFKKFAGVDAWPVCLDTQDTEEIIRAVELIAPVYGGINLEDIAAPRCFEIEARLREKLDIPVFHDDQHGTAIVVVGALRNALRVVGKKLSDCKVVVCGVGAAGSAIIRLLLKQRPGDIVAVDVDGIVHRDRPGLDDNLKSIAAVTNKDNTSGRLHDALVGADVFIGVSAPNLFGADQVATMNPDAIVFALANPDPEIDPMEAQKHAAVVATGRSDFPNQINNVLAFPGLPGPAGRARPHHHRRDAAGRRDRHRGRGRRGEVERLVHRAERVRRVRGARRRRSRPEGGGRTGLASAA